ncbi:leaf rust 10 disease-resistance locus receptor-like protein kinase-like 1.1 protein [Tanacetum coccineum]
MNINFVFTFAILSCLPDLLHSAMSTCPKRFSCQDTPFKYPFYNATNKGCGLIKVNCISNLRANFNFGKKHSYAILPKVDYASSVTIHNTTFEKLVNNKSCEALMNNFTSPRPLLYSISINPFITLFKCRKKLNYSTDETGKLGGYLILITVMAGLAFILCPIILIIRRLNKNSPFWYLSSKDDTQCLEEGSIFFSVSVFSYAELEDATKTFDPSRELGGGGFGTVYYGSRFWSIKAIANNANPVSTAPQGTPGYVDPQYHQRYQLTDKSDVYSFGVVLVELISSMVAVDLNRSQDEISLANLALNRIQTCELDQLIDHALVSVSKGEMMAMMTSVAELAFRCLQYHSEMRPTMSEVLDVLRDIQREGRIDDHDRVGDLEIVKAPPLFETTDMELLLKDFPPSPVSINSEWQSDINCDKQHNEVLEK